MRAMRCLLAVVLAAFLAACSSSLPPGVLSSGDMEDVLYDMHLAQAMYESGTVRNNESSLLALRQSVLDKHGITSAEWDSSYMYYCRNAHEMYAIYQSLSKRLDQNITALGGTLDGVQGAEADTANVWNGEPSFILMQQAPYNVYSFAITPDSTFHDGDRIVLQYDGQFIFQDGMREVITVLAVHYERPDSVLKDNPSLSRDSIVTNVHRFMSDGHGVITVNNDVDRLHIKKISGYMYLNQGPRDVSSAINPTTLRLVALRNVKLLHLPTMPPAPMKKEEEKQDSVKRDSLMRDSIMRTPPKVVVSH